MTIQPPETPDPAPANAAVPDMPAAPLRPATADGTSPRDPLWDLVALLALLAVTALLYALIGPSAGMITGVATGLFTTYRRTTTPPADTPPPLPRPATNHNEPYPRAEPDR